MHKNGINANIGIRGFTMWKQKQLSDKMLPPVSIEPRPLMNLWIQVQHSPFWTNLTFAKSKNQVVQEQKFKDLLGSTSQVSPERIMLNLESEV